MRVLRGDERMKGQAAMEFLMTYGWAILVVLACIGALTYFGVLKPYGQSGVNTTYCDARNMTYQFNDPTHCHYDKKGCFTYANNYTVCGTVSGTIDIPIINSSNQTS